MTNETGFNPTGDLVLIKPLKIEETTAGGIVLSKMTIDKEGVAAKIGHVVAMGSVARQDPRMEGIDIGDMIFFTRYSGDFMTFDGIKYVTTRCSQVLGKGSRLPDSELNAARGSLEVFGVNT